MNPQNKKKLENFKKEIKKDAIDRKKFQIRRELPYYEVMFNQIDESSNGTNSRSSRFPIRGCPSKERASVFEQRRTHSQDFRQVRNEDKKLHEEQQQTRYLQYLKNINSTFSQQNKTLVEKSLTERYGNNCFSDIQKLREQMLCDLLIYQQALYSGPDQIIVMEKMTQNCWSFVIASLKIAQNERFEEISKITFTLITGLFNQWYFKKLMQLINQNQNSTASIIFDKMKALEHIQIQIQEPILSKLLEYNHNDANTETLQMTTQYMMDKMKMFERIERRMLELFDVQETQNFSEMIFNFGFAHCVEFMVQILQTTDVDFDLSVQIYSLINKYFAMYPININSETETQEKFNTFMINYLDSMETFCKEIEQRTNGMKITQNDTLFQFMESAQSLIHSMLWRESIEENSSYQILSIYRHLINISLNIDGLIARLDEFKGFHRKMTQFSLTFYSFFQGSRSFFIKHEYVQYVSLLIMYLHQTKLKLKSQNHSLIEFQELLVVNNSQKQQISNLQCNLIYALHIIKYSQDNESCQQMSHDVAKLLEYTEFVYRMEQKNLEDIRNFENISNINLIFEDNVSLFLRMFLNPSQKHTSNQNQENQQHSNHFHGEIEI